MANIIDFAVNKIKQTANNLFGDTNPNQAGNQNFVTNTASKVGNYLKQDFNRAPQVQAFNNISHAIQTPQFQNTIKQAPIQFGNTMLNGVNTVGKAVGNQNLTPPELYPFNPPKITLGNVAQRVVPNAPLTSFLTGQSQKIPGQINQAAKTFNEQNKYIGYTGPDPEKRKLGQDAVNNVVGSINLEGFAKPTLSKAAEYLNNTADKAAIEKIKNFIIDVQETGGKKNYGSLGQDIQSIANDVFGDKARNLTNKQLANVLDTTLKEIGRKPNRLALGLGTDNLRTPEEIAANAGKKTPIDKYGEMLNKGIPDLNEGNVANAGLYDIKNPFSNSPVRRDAFEALKRGENPQVAAVQARSNQDGFMSDKSLDKAINDAKQEFARLSHVAQQPKVDIAKKPLKMKNIAQQIDKEINGGVDVTQNIRNGRIVPGVGSPTAEGTLGLKSNPQPKGAGLQSNILSGDISGSQTPSVQPSSQLLNDTRKILTDQGGLKEKKLVGRLKVSDRYDPELRSVLEGKYVPKSNAETVATAKKLVRLDPNAAETRALSPQNAVDQAIGAELFNYHMDNGNVTKANQIINATSGTNEGQMVQILSQYDKTTPQGAIKFANNAVKAYNETHPNKQLSINDTQVKSIYDMAKSIQKMPEGRERNIAANDLIEHVNSLIPSSIVDKAITVWKAGLLTSLRTHERNLLGNTIMSNAEIAKDVIASPVDRLMALRTGQRSLALNTQGTAEGVKKGLVAAKDIVQKGYDPEETIAKFDQRHITWGNNPLEQALKKGTDAVFRTLGGEDKPFLHGATARSLYDQAKVAAINTGKGGDQKFIQNLVANPTEKMIKTAQKEADYATFHDKNVLSEVANSIKRAAQNPKYGKWGEFGKAVTEVLAPFTGVPSSIVGKTVDYSPIGLAKGTVNVGRVLAGNMPELQRQAAQEIGRGVIGTGLFGIGAYLASKGLMTGQPKDPAEADLWAAEGKQANSVLINGKWRSINSIGPQNLVMLAGGKYQEEMSKPDGSLGGFAGSIGKDQLNQTFLAGVQGPLNAITDPARYGQNYVGNQLSSTVPNIVKDTSKAFDPYQRENNTISDYFTNSIPGLRNKNIEKRDVLGNIMPQEPTGVGAYVDLLNSKTPIRNDVVDELSRLNSTGNSATPSKLGKAQTIGGEKKTLTPQELNTLESQVGPQVTQSIRNLISTADYQSLPDEEKAKAIDSVVTQVRKQVRGGIDLKNPGSLTAPNSGGSSGQQYTLVNPDTGSVKRIDLSKPVEAPTLTGNYELDKKLTSKYNSALTSRANDIVALYEAKKIDQKTAEAELEKLKSNKLSSSGGKGTGKKAKKLKIAKIKVPRAKGYKRVRVKLQRPKFGKVRLKTKTAKSPDSLQLPA